VAEGPLLGAEFSSFVGLASIPMRHRLTLGELALLFNRDFQIGASLEVVPMAGWNREMYWPDTGLTWLSPSPNMPRFETTVVYPGQVLVEGTNLSEGRGTTTPFEVMGAPFIDPNQLAEQLAAFRFPGMRIRPVRFRPTFNKWHDQSCGGVALTVTAPEMVRSYEATLAIFAAVHAIWPEEFACIPPPYEYETEKLPIDILTGSDALSSRLRSGQSINPEEISNLAKVDTATWTEQIEEVLLYL
jgi:uncharacterized protein YbbC (DUF1343 family)